MAGKNAFCLVLLELCCRRDSMGRKRFLCPSQHWQVFFFGILKRFRDSRDVVSGLGSKPLDKGPPGQKLQLLGQARSLNLCTTHAASYVNVI